MKQLAAFSTFQIGAQPQLIATMAIRQDQINNSESLGLSICSLLQFLPHVLKALGFQLSLKQHVDFPPFQIGAQPQLIVMMAIR